MEKTHWLNKKKLKILIKLVNVKSNLVPFTIFLFMAQKNISCVVVSPLMSERCSQITDFGNYISPLEGKKSQIKGCAHLSFFNVCGSVTIELTVIYLD